MAEKTPSSITQEYDVIEIAENGINQTWVEVCIEDSVNLLVNGTRVASLTISPNDLEAYAYGYLICEGIVSGIDAITDVHVDYPNIYAKVSLFSREISPSQTEIRSSGCVGSVDLSRCFMVCTGRLPAGMVAKAYRAGISIFASNTAPFSTGICLARQVNMTLAGFVRPPRAMIYSVPERIHFD